MAGGTCLGLVARTVGDDIVALVMPFIEENITKPDWRQREAATYAFGSILEGPSPDKLVPLVNMALNFMLSALMKDPNNHSMKDVPNVAEKACGALYFLAQGYEDAGSSSSPLTPFFQEIVQALLNVTHREDAGESRLRTAAYEALNEVVRCSNDETAPMVIIQKLGSSEPTKYHFMQYADQIMGLFLRVFASRSATAHEEAMLAIGALAYATGADFAKYMTEFYKYLEMGLQNFEDYQYLLYAMPMLQSAAELSAHTAGADDDMTEYTNSLRNGILEAYSGIFQGFKGSPKTQLLMPYAPQVLQFLDSLYMEKDMDDVVTKTAIGVLGDLADTLGGTAGHLIQQSVSSKDFLKECLSSDDHLIKESAEWAKLAISRAISF
ncbi:hypothetical protein V8G54_005213 [Vigna mungo]|uniref:Importin subunit beta-1/Transportin-1-like TPR repeats domain-containing protein n=1 Tax=Vigna mungo TaxID=3915 RepID=A0AAQ3PI97_VIGMU